MALCRSAQQLIAGYLKPHRPLGTRGRRRVKSAATPLDRQVSAGQTQGGLCHWYVCRAIIWDFKKENTSIFFVQK